MLELVRVCRAGWVCDMAARRRPLFPGVDETTGRFVFFETFNMEALRTRLAAAGRSIGMHYYQVGLWSLRKDACEAVASAGQGAIAARMLGHWHVNSRTMDRVYRADLRCVDLGAFWTGREPQKLGAPLTCLSARRVPESAGVRGMADVPPDAQERLAIERDARVVQRRRALP